MRSDTRQRLLDLSARFYRHHGASFDATRNHPWEGWSRLWDVASSHLATQTLSCLDAGCGNGRFIDFLSQRCSELRYVGADLDRELISAASDKLEDLPLARYSITFRVVDLVRDGVGRLSRDGPFDLVVLFGVLHHVPDEVTRRQLVADLGSLAAPRGLLAVSIWRLDQDPKRLEKKRVAWDLWNPRQPESGRVDLADLDDGDTLLGWRGDDEVPRYCHFPTDEEIERIADLGPKLELIDRFEADGPSGRDNLYLIWRRANLPAP